MDSLACSFRPFVQQEASTTRSKRILVKFNSKSNLFPPDFFDLQKFEETPNFKFTINRKPRARSCRNVSDNAGKFLDFKDDMNKENKENIKPNYNIIKNKTTTNSTRFKNTGPPIKIHTTIYPDTQQIINNLPMIQRSKSVSQQLMQSKVIKCQKLGYISIQQVVNDRQEAVVKQYKTEQNVVVTKKPFNILNTIQTNKQSLLRVSNQSQVDNKSLVVENTRKSESSHQSSNMTPSNQLYQRNLFKIMKRRVQDRNLCKFFQ